MRIIGSKIVQIKHTLKPSIAPAFYDRAPLPSTWLYVLRTRLLPVVIGILRQFRFGKDHRRLLERGACVILDPATLRKSSR